MTQQPFSRPGAIDLSGLGRPPAPQQAAPTAGGTSGPGATGGAYSVAITQENFQQVLQESMTAPVVIVFHSATQAPGSEQYAADVAAEAERLEGRLLAALVDVDAHPEIAQAMQIPQVPLTMVVLDGRPGVLLVLATGTRGQLHVVTVDPGCGPAGGTLLAQVTVA